MNKLAMIEYAGIPGATQECLRAIVRFVHFGDEITEAKILSSGNKHCFLLRINSDYVAIKSGFASGYLGGGPNGLLMAIKILEDHNNKIMILECNVSHEIIEKIDSSCLLTSDIDSIEKGKSEWIHGSRSKLNDWFYSGDCPKQKNTKEFQENFPKTINFSLIDERILDLALSYKNNPEESIETGYKRLEQLIRKRTGLKEHGVKLFNKAFVEKDCKLIWGDFEESANQGKALLFKSVFMAYRNPRAHNEMESSDEDLLREFILMNQLFVLEGESQEPPKLDATTQ